MGQRIWRIAVILLTLLGTAPALAEPETVAIDRSAAASPFPHFWETMMGSGRAALALRDSYRQDLHRVKQATGLGYVRFHAIFHDELGVYDEDAAGQPIYNFQYVDQIYDGLLAEGVRPFVELSFMPKLLARRLDLHPFWYQPIVSPPRDWARWDGLITELARHLIERYGADEVAQWYFEVWNEPNLDFWTGKPAEASYFTLYDHTARALKAVEPRLRVGGPSTAQAAWLPAFLTHVAQGQAPLDFVSTHVYGDDDPALVLGAGSTVRRGDLVCPAVRQARDQIDASPRPHLPLLVTEYNLTSNSRDPRLASPFMGPFLADTIMRCAGLADMMSYWTFSDVFEEQGVLRLPFSDGFGLVALGGVPKPSFAAFALLHQLGTERLPAEAGNVLATRRADGTLAIAAWNAGARPIELALTGLGGAVTARISRVDAAHGDALPAYRAMGEPTYPTPAQLALLRTAAEPGAPETAAITAGRLTLALPESGLALVEIGG